MRGKAQAQPDFLTVVNLNAAVPADHPLRAIKRRVDGVLQKLSPLFDEQRREFLQDPIHSALDRSQGMIRWHRGVEVYHGQKVRLCLSFSTHAGSDRSTFTSFNLFESFSPAC